MQFKIDKHGQLHIIATNENPTIETEVCVLSADQTEELILPAVRKFLNKKGIATNL